MNFRVKHCGMHPFAKYFRDCRIFFFFFFFFFFLLQNGAHFFGRSQICDHRFASVPFMDFGRSWKTIATGTELSRATFLFFVKCAMAWQVNLFLNFQPDVTKFSTRRSLLARSAVVVRPCRTRWGQLTWVCLTERSQLVFHYLRVLEMVLPSDGKWVEPLRLETCTSLLTAAVHWSDLRQPRHRRQGQCCCGRPRNVAHTCDSAQAAAGRQCK